MNEVCKKCDKVIAAGHHQCEADGRKVAVRVLSRDQFMEETMARTPWFVIPLPEHTIDSARELTPLDSCKPIILGDDYYGAATARLLNNPIKVHYIPKAEIVSYPVHDGQYVIPKGGEEL